MLQRGSQKFIDTTILGNYSCHSTTPVALNTALKVAILDSNKTQCAVARETGIHVTKLSKIVRGHRHATQAERRLLSKAVGRPQGEIFPEAAA